MMNDGDMVKEEEDDEEVVVVQRWLGLLLTTVRYVQVDEGAAE